MSHDKIKAQAVTVMTGLAHDHDDLLGTGRVGRVLHPFVVWCPAREISRGWSPATADDPPHPSRPSNLQT